MQTAGSYGRYAPSWHPSGSETPDSGDNVSSPSRRDRSNGGRERLLPSLRIPRPPIAEGWDSGAYFGPEVVTPVGTPGRRGSTSSQTQGSP